MGQLSMSAASSYLSKKRHHTHSRSGVALILVLGSIVLISVLVLSLLGRTRTELQSTKLFAGSTNARLLADNVANIVMSQIRQATTENASTSWASQPGAIRTFDTSGAFAKIYKLYSSDKMIDTQVNPATEASALASWSSQTAFFTDLNQPSGKNYPILAPPVTGTSAITGYSINSAPGATLTQPVPMPAKWLYVLKDGTLVAPTGSASATIATVSGATSSNPIVGRVAFWTDDETSKININTASEGTFWDTPRFEGTDPATTNPAARPGPMTDRHFARFQPANGEFQRYPGHPATVCLSTVFPWLNTESLAKLSPRVAYGGSKEGTVVATSSLSTPTQVKADRLYATVDDFIFNINRAVQQDVSGNTAFAQDSLQLAQFFLTAHSRAPEVTLFGTPRVSIWPVHADYASNNLSPYTTAFDRLSAFCSTLGTTTPRRYYFQRQDAYSSTSDYANIPRNKELYAYLQNLTARKIPGFGGSLKDKYTADRDQILTEIFDYIRCTNLFDDNLANASSSTPLATFKQFTAPRTKTTNSQDKSGMWPGHGQVTPIVIGNTHGLGRMPIISEVGVLLICTADGNGLPPTATNSAHDARTISNLTDSALLLNSAGKTVNRNYVETATLSQGFPANSTLAPSYGLPGSALFTNQRRIQAMLVFQMSCPMAGWDGLSPNYEIDASDLDVITIAGQKPFQNASSTLKTPFYSGLVDGITPTGAAIGGVRFSISKADRSQDGNLRVNGWSNGGNQNRYPFVSSPFTVQASTSSATLALGSSAAFTLKVYAIKPDGTRTLTQTYKIKFPQTTVPAPDLLWWGVSSTGVNSKADEWWNFDNRIARITESPGNFASPLTGCLFRADGKTIPNQTVPSTWKLSESESGGSATSTRSDVLRTLTSKKGDYRLLAAKADIDSDTDMDPHPKYADGVTKIAHTFSDSDYTDKYVGSDRTLSGGLVGDQDGAPILQYMGSKAPTVPNTIDVRKAAYTGDWDNGIGCLPDGPYANKPDEGNTYGLSTGKTPYFDSERYGATTGATFFSPNRILPSAGMFGSLPTGVKLNIPYQTLLFRPQKNHPQSRTSQPSQPPDHLFLDLFTMPVVEPYAISEPLSTAGKINMNYQILPYTYIARSTAIQAAMKAEMISAVTSSSAIASLYKENTNTDPTGFTGRFALNLSDTNGSLRQFKSRFDSGDIFRSASEICDIYLVPKGESWTSDSTGESFWRAHALTGDDSRERPYANLYAKLTTKSNTYRVHYRVQTLVKSINTSAGEWREASDTVSSELRGSFLIERYLNLNDATIPDFAAAATPTTASLESHYQFRIINSTLFTP